MNQAVETRVHGERSTYRAGCKCRRCRAANAEAECLRTHRPTLEHLTTVSASRAQVYICGLQSAGVGYRRVAELAAVSDATVKNIRNGRLLRIRPSTEAAILGIVASHALGSTVKAHGTWRLLRALRREGFTLRELADRLGLQEPLNIDRRQKRVTVKTALRIRRLHRLSVEGEDPSTKERRRP